MTSRRVLLVICDGWGEAPPSEGNAITLARKPTFDRWRRDYPGTTLDASGEAVGLPAGLMGNSEVGHLNLGAGRMVPQDLLRIDLSLRDGSFFDNPVLVEAIDRAKRSDRTVHFLGLVSDGGVHSHERHLSALLELARRRGAPRVRVHAFTDGRDTPPRSALRYIDPLEAELAGSGGAVASVTGRYFAMDRDSRWDRVERAWEALRFGRGLRAPTARAAVEEAYARGESDEFIAPTVMERGGTAVGVIEDGDSVVFFNFRADRARQLTRVLTDPDFREFDRGGVPKLHVVCFTEYKKEFRLPVAFPTPTLDRILAAVWSDAGVRNLRLAETEKYAHVTYFFNGGLEAPFPGEERLLVPSWRGATYDLHPQMSAPEIANEAVRAMASDRFGAIVVNFANADMVGHTGTPCRDGRRDRDPRPLLCASRRGGSRGALGHRPDRRPRKRRADDRPLDGRAPHRPHDEPRALPDRERRDPPPRSGRGAVRRRADPARVAGTAGPEGDDGAGPDSVAEREP